MWDCRSRGVLTVPILWYIIYTYTTQSLSSHLYFILVEAQTPASVLCSSIVSCNFPFLMLLDSTASLRGVLSLVHAPFYIQGPLFWFSFRGSPQYCTSLSYRQFPFLGEEKGSSLVNMFIVLSLIYTEITWRWHRTTRSIDGSYHKLPSLRWYWRTQPYIITWGGKQHWPLHF